MVLEDIKEKLENVIVAVATVNGDGKPHNICVEVNKIIENKIIITNNYMRNTIENIKNNPNVSLVFWKEEKGWRINGKADYFDSGQWLDFVKALKENKGHPAKGALVVNVNEIRELG